MFADVARHQQPHQFPHTFNSPSQHQTQYSFGSEGAFETLPQPKRKSHPPEPQNLQQTFRKPQQYAIPISSSHNGPQTLLEVRGPRADSSEHMLRRKTPNGTLAAGYDGTSVEWISKPHAHKHIVMPISDTAGRPVHDTPPFDHSLEQRYAQSALDGRIDGGRFQNWKSGLLSPQDKFGGALSIDGESGATQWRQQSQLTPSLDSMLHQAPGPHQFYDMGGFHQVPTVLQPMWPPSVGPTSSNAPGPYGPYWPNGAFEPYRPAASRDKRFYTQFANFSINDPSEFHSKAQDGLNWTSDSGLSSEAGEQTRHGQWTPQSQKTPQSQNSGFEDEFFPPQEQRTIRRENFELIGSENNRSESIPLAYRGKPIHITYPSMKTDTPTWSSFPSPVPIASPSSPECLRSPNQLQFKEKVLEWAHRIYIVLLASIHQSRRLSQNKQSPTGRIQSQPSIFPKPPRQFPSISQSVSEITRKDAQSARPYQERDKTSHYDIGPDVIDTTEQHRTMDMKDMHWLSRRDNPLHTEQFLRGNRTSTHPQIPMAHHRSENRFPPGYAVTPFSQDPQPNRAVADAEAALDMLSRLSQESGWKWVDGLLLGGCLAYGLGDYEKALQWYSRVLAIDTDNVEAISNMAASCLSLNRRKEAEHYWLRSVKLRPSYFEAVEHLIGLLCGDHRAKEAIKIIEFVENALKYPADGNLPGSSDFANSDYGRYMQPANSMGYCDSINSRHGGYDISPQDNGRMIALIHAKGNMLYALGDNTGAAKAFEDAIMVAAGNRREGIAGLITQILRAFSPDGYLNVDSPGNQVNFESILLMPDQALETAKLVFPIHGDLPGLIAVPDGQSKKAAISTTSNSLLSLAKIYQDGMSSSGATAGSPKAASGVQDILALYYLSLSLQPSPSTANNVGILLASIQQPGPKSRISRVASQQPLIAGVVPGSGIHLALLYYNYGLNLDQRHAHLYTNLGSLLKDIGQLNAAIKMYEKAVECDGSFDIALANLANAVKDQGRISEAIEYYKRAVASSPDFAEAVCGLANALNSVCGWQGRGGVVYRNNEFDRWHVDEQGMLLRVELPHTKNSGWIGRVVAIVEKQLNDGQSWGRGVLQSIDLEEFLNRCHLVNDPQIYTQRQSDAIVSSLTQWAGQNWEGAKVVRLVERATKRLGWQLYQNRYMRRGGSCSSISYARPQLPAALATPSAPTVLPFHTFTCPLTAKQIRKISQRNGLRISCSTLRAPWLPANIFEPPSPPQPYLKVGYVSSDFNNHPLAHLMQSVFGFHNPSRVKAYCYATTASDNSVHRQQIEREAPVFHDASAWSVDRLVKQVVVDGIHILINLNGYTRGARNEVFAARPAPIQMSFMGFAGTLGSEWCDYLLADTTSIPPRTLRPYRNNIDVLDQVHDDNNGDEQEDWVYGENIIYTRDTFFCCDHRQSAPDSQEQQLKWPEEQKRRWRMRKELFPELSDDTVILGNFNQLYKIEPTTFRTWLRILERIPKAILWLLRFPDLGETNLRQTALQWAGAEVASRIIFTDVAPKHQHISRARVCDLFLDTPECNAHTTAADVLWSGTPLLTFPRYDYKMCSRMAASILKGALPKNAEGDEAAEDLIVSSDMEYETRAVELGTGLADVLALAKRDRRGSAKCRLTDLRKILYEARWTSALFDTRRWVRDLEDAYEIAWKRWVDGEGGDIWL